MEAALHLQPKAPAYPEGRAVSEARIAVDDGYIWPIDRAQMVTPAAIRERMVEDIGRLVADGGDAPCVTMDDLRRRGWSQRQIEAHATIAFETHKAKRIVETCRGSITRRDSLPAIAASALASLVFVVSLALWAGHFTGAL